MIGAGQVHDEQAHFRTDQGPLAVDLVCGTTHTDNAVPCAPLWLFILIVHLNLRRPEGGG